MATLTVTIREDLNLNGRDRGSEITHEISSITETMHRIIDVQTSADMVLLQTNATAASASGQTLTAANVKYIRVTHISGGTSVTLTVRDTGTGEYAIKLLPGDSYIINDLDMQANATGDSSAGGSLADLDEISAQAVGSAASVEVFAALA